MAVGSRAASPPKRRQPSISLDLTGLPPVRQPTPPTNTLLITNLRAASIFSSANIATIRTLLERSGASIIAFAPLRPLRRILVAFQDVADAVAIREALDGQSLMGDRVRVYFGAPTPLPHGSDRSDGESDGDAVDAAGRPAPHRRNRLLAAPRPPKMFFISPPPSPPHGWEVKKEDPPNKHVHADDLATALANLRPSLDLDINANTTAQATELPISPTLTDDASSAAPKRKRTGNATSDMSWSHSPTSFGSTSIVFRPDDHGAGRNLPAIAVEDLTLLSAPDPPEDEQRHSLSLAAGPSNGFAHTARPPVELMTDA